MKIKDYPDLINVTKTKHGFRYSVRYVKDKEVLRPPKTYPTAAAAWKAANRAITARAAGVSNTIDPLPLKK